MPLVVDNSHVGQHLKDKMLLDDMIITDNTEARFDKSLLIVNRIFEDGASVQVGQSLHARRSCPRARLCPPVPACARMCTRVHAGVYIYMCVCVCVCVCVTRDRPPTALSFNRRPRHRV